MAKTTKSEESKVHEGDDSSVTSFDLENDVEGYKDNIDNEECWKNVEIKINGTKKVS